MKEGESKSESKREEPNLGVTKTVSKPARKPSRKTAKDPHNPKRPASAFFMFMEEFRKKVNEENPNNDPDLWEVYNPRIKKTHQGSALTNEHSRGPTCQDHLPKIWLEDHPAGRFLLVSELSDKVSGRQRKMRGVSQKQSRPVKAM